MKTKSLDVLEKAQLPLEQARAILQVMEEEFLTDQLATKSDLADLKSDFADLRSDLAELKSGLKLEWAAFATKTDLMILKSELHAAMSELKAELMRWMFLFWVGQMAATLAIVKYLK